MTARKKKPEELNLERKSSLKTKHETVHMEFMPGRVPNIQPLMDLFASLHSLQDFQIINAEAGVDDDRYDDHDNPLPGSALYMEIGYKFREFETEAEYHKRILGSKTQIDQKQNELLDLLTTISRIKNVPINKLVQQHQDLNT